MLERTSAFVKPAVVFAAHHHEIARRGSAPMRVVDLVMRVEPSRVRATLDYAAAVTRDQLTPQVRGHRPRHLAGTDLFAGGVVHDYLNARVARQPASGISGDHHPALHRGNAILGGQRRCIGVYDDIRSVWIWVGPQRERRHLHQRIGASLRERLEPSGHRVTRRRVGDALDGSLEGLAVGIGKPSPEMHDALLDVADDLQVATAVPCLGGFPRHPAPVQRDVPHLRVRKPDSIGGQRFILVRRSELDEPADLVPRKQPPFEGVADSREELERRARPWSSPERCVPSSRT